MFVHDEVSSMDKRSKNWSTIKHGDGSKHTNNEDKVVSGDLRTKQAIMMHEYMEKYI